MRWYHYVAYFFGKAFLVNAIPHFFSGVMGHPFATPPGEGLSPAWVNVLRISSSHTYCLVGLGISSFDGGFISWWQVPAVWQWQCSWHARSDAFTAVCERAMSAPDEVRAMFPGHPFGAPCTEADLLRAEAALGETLPTILRDLYLAFDGFLGSTNASFFWPLFGREGLVAMNQFYRGDDLFPQTLVSQCLFFGDNGCGPQWGFKRDLAGKVIQWDAEWGTDFEVVGDSPLDVWRAEKQSYDSLGNEV